jgi:hypothetical protein
VPTRRTHRTSLREAGLEDDLDALVKAQTVARLSAGQADLVAALGDGKQPPCALDTRWRASLALAGPGGFGHAGWLSEPAGQTLNAPSAAL